MARINIDDELRADPRFHKLCSLLGRELAYGSLICLWDLGMVYWKRNRSFIPKSMFDMLNHRSSLIEAGFVWEQGDGFYCSGAKEKWDFLLSRSEAGKKSAAIRMGKYGTAVPLGASNSDQNSATTPEQNPNKTEPSSSSSSSNKILKEQTQSVTPMSSKSKKLEAGELSLEEQNQSRALGNKTITSESARFIATYVKSWQARYGSGARPDIGGKVLGGIKQLLKDMPVTEACDLIQVYVQMDENWFNTKCHDFFTFKENINKVRVALATGSSKPKKQSKGVVDLPTPPPLEFKHE